MGIFVRFVGLLVLLLAVVGFVCCVAGIVGIWKAHQYLSDQVEVIYPKLDVGLKKLSDADRNAWQALAEARQQVAVVNKMSAELSNDLEERQGITSRLQRLLLEQVGPKLNDAGGRLATLSDAATAVSSLLRSFQDLPLSKAGRVSPDQLAGLADQTAQFSDTFRKLQTLVGHKDIAATEQEIVAESKTVDVILQNWETTLADLQVDLDTAREDLPRLKTELLGWMQLIAIVVTVVLVWVAVSQISLFAHGLTWCRGG